MSVPHTNPFRVVVSDAALFYQIPCSGRGYLAGLIVYSATNPTYTFDLYSRAFSASALNIQTLLASENSLIKVQTTGDHRLQVGDFVTIAGTSVVGYDVSNLYITQVYDNRTVEVGVAYASSVTTGTIALDITAGYRPLWEIIPQGTASGGYFRFGASDSNAWMPPFQNRDPERGVGAPKVLYAKFSATGTYYGTLTSVGVTV